MTRFFPRWFSTRPVAAPKSARPRVRPVLQALDDRITPTLSFATQQAFAVGSSAVSVSVADFNGDGRPDLVTANFNANTVSVLANTTAAGAGTPTFAAQQTFAVGSGPFSVAVGDFNGDGRPDIATANLTDTTVSVLLNTTAAGAVVPTFAAQQTVAVGSGPNSVAVADVNGDGRPDLVTTHNSILGVLLNTTATGAATPTFAAEQLIANGLTPVLSIADLNADGRPDLVTGNGSDIVLVLLNTTPAGSGTTTFAAPQSFAAGTSPASASVADVNGDGRPDLVTAHANTNTVSVFLNTTAVGASTATFAGQQTFAVGNSPASVAAADFNGDGRPDLVATNSGANTVSVLLNTTAAGATTPTFAVAQTFAVGTSPESLAVADFNGDGRPDLAAGNRGANTVSVLLNTSTGGTVTTPALVGANFGVSGGRGGLPGVSGYNRTTGNWSLLTLSNADALAAAPNGNVVANFVGLGVYYYRASTATWTQINGQPASALAIDQYGNATINFGPAFGTYQYNLAAGYRAMPGTSAGADKLAVSANGDVIADFTGFGVYRFRWTTGWQQINGHDATSLAVDPNGFVVASFTGFGVGQYIPYANGWRTVAFSTASAVTADGMGNIFASFAGFGIGRWSAATNTWAGFGPSTVTATSLAADLFGNLSMALPGFGVYEYSPTGGWVQRRSLDPGVLSLGR